MSKASATDKKLDLLMRKLANLMIDRMIADYKAGKLKRHKKAINIPQCK